MKQKASKIILLTLVFSLLSFPLAFAEDGVIYPDLLDHYAREAIEALYETGAINYPKDEALYPDQPISRAQFLFTLLTTKGITPQADLKQTNFDDVTVEDWFFPYVETAYQLGIIMGDTNTKQFYPEAAITKQEAIVMLLRALGEGEAAKQYKDVHKDLEQFKDAATIGVWAKNSIAYAATKKYITGAETADGKYLFPNNEITKAEAATIIYNTLYQRLSLELLKKDDVDAKPITYFTKLEAKASAYNSADTNVGSYSRTGLSVRFGLVAVDPKVIPLGTHLYIPGYGYAIAADTGGAIKDLKVDLYMLKRSDALKFGRQNVVVYVLDPIEIAQK